VDVAGEAKRGGAIDLAPQGQVTDMVVAPAPPDWSAVLRQVRQWVAATPDSDMILPTKAAEEGDPGRMPYVGTLAFPTNSAFSTPGPVVESRELQLSIGTIQVTLESPAGPPLPVTAPPPRPVDRPVRSRLNRYYLRIR
jgi:hypothetical protein